MDAHFIKENISRIRKNMETFPDAKLMAVVKTRTPEEIRFVLDCGITLLGENRVQELLSHFEHLDSRAEIHFIGTLQKNKVKYIIDKVSMIESLDSLSLAAEIDRQAAKHSLRMPVLIEVNIGRESSKSGVLPEELSPFCHQIQSYENLIPSGLMTIAPICGSAEEYSVYFSEMEHLRHMIFTSHFPQIRHPILSMGMSGSYLPALANGADIVRIGEGIFGKRNIPVKL